MFKLFGKVEGVGYLFIGRYPTMDAVLSAEVDSPYGVFRVEKD